jgi:hypothetical protein
MEQNLEEELGTFNASYMLPIGIIHGGKWKVLTNKKMKIIIF